MLISIALTPKLAPICGSDVAMIVPSSICMKKATATTRAMVRACTGCRETPFSDKSEISFMHAGPSVTPSSPIDSFDIAGIGRGF
jgi:hypothetical protein